MFDHFLIWEGDMAAAGVKACGIFSLTHIIVALCCLALVAVSVYLSRNMSEKTVRRVVLCIAIFVTVYECVKIGFNWAHGGFTPNNWLPLTFCSFSTYSYYGIALFRGKIYEASKGFIAGGGIIAGLAFIVLPMTSVATYPMLHLLSLHSMIYHSLMMYVGLLVLVRGMFRFDMQGYRQFMRFTLPSCFLALAVNMLYAFFDDVTLCNMMFLSHPYRLAQLLPFVGAIYDFFPPLYTLLILMVYLSLPFFLPYGVLRLAGAIKKRIKKNGKA